MYHHNGANSSGRSSNCDDGDMQSDISIEEDVIDLNQKVMNATLSSFNNLARKVQVPYSQNNLSKFLDLYVT